MVEGEDLKLALYTNISRGYNASAQRLVASLFGWLAYVAFLKNSETQIIPLTIESFFSNPVPYSIPIILLAMSFYFWIITCYLGINLRFIENNLIIGTTKMKEIVAHLQWKKLDDLIGWTGPKLLGMTLGEWSTLVVIGAIYYLGARYCSLL